MTAPRRPPKRRHARELTVFCLVGASGYVVNLVVFQSVYAGGAGHLLAATIAFLVAVTNNYILNRRWTFAGASATAKRVQAPRFLAVSVATLAVSLGLLEALVRGAEAPALLAQACAIVLATPMNFVGAKLWSFRGATAWRAAPAEGPAR